MEKLSKEQAIILKLFKEFNESYNSRSISKKVGIGHSGAFKILKKLEKENIVFGKRIGKAVIYKLNMENPIAIRKIELALTFEAEDFGKWLEEFRELKDKFKFSILFGSVLRNEKEAKDIDVLIVASTHEIKEIRNKIEEKNKILSKKIHLLIQSEEDFISDLENKNKVIYEIIKTGIVLYGQENITKYLRKLV
jgi:predicted nucleotidyltransferase